MNHRLTSNLFFPNNGTLKVTWTAYLGLGGQLSATCEPFVHPLMKANSWYLMIDHFTNEGKKYSQVTLKWEIFIPHEPIFTCSRFFINDQFQDKIKHKFSTRSRLSSTCSILIKDGIKISEKGLVKVRLDFKIIKPNPEIAMLIRNDTHLKVLRNLKFDQDFKDLILITEDEVEFQAHRNVIANSSSVLKTMITSKDNKDHYLDDGDKIKVPFHSRLFELYYDHVYGFSRLDEDSDIKLIQDMFMIGEYYHTCDLCELCCDLIIDQLSPENIELVLDHDMMKLTGNTSAQRVTDVIMQINELIKDQNEINLDEVEDKNLAGK